MKNYKLGFSLAGCSLIIGTFVGINLLTSPSFPWSIFPSFAALWWPLAAYSHAKKSAMTMAVLGSSLTTVFFIVVNLITSPGFPWCIFPIFALLWWPLAVHMAKNKNTLQTSIEGSFLIALFFAVVNAITSPGFPWAFFPVFALTWWPLSVYCAVKNKPKLFSLAGSLLVISFFYITDFITTPPMEWAFYPAFPVLIWPAVAFLKKSVKIEKILMSSGFLLAGYYIVLNVLVSPSYPWSIFVAYAILLTMISSSFWFGKNNNWTLWGTAVISALFVASAYYVAGIKDIWIAEVALIGTSAQACALFSTGKNYKSLAFTGSITLSIIIIMEYLSYRSSHIWLLYLGFPLIWPLIMSLFPRQIGTLPFALFSSATGILYYGILNILLSPAHVWVIYPAFVLLWWPLAAFYAKTRKPMSFSILGSLLIILFFGATNYFTSPRVIWFAFPSFLVLWWPLSTMFTLKKRRVLAEEETIEEL